MSFNFKLVAGDTDGIAFKKPDGKPFTPEERTSILAALNGEMPELIRWEDDGQLKKQIVVKTKNYVMQDESGKVKIKGSGLKATNKEKALQRFTQEIIELLLKDRKDHIYDLYMRYAKECLHLTDITEWSSKKTVTKSVLNPERTNERRVLEALNGKTVNEGDKVYMFFKTSTELCLRENFDGTYDADTLLDKLYNTLSIFSNVIDIELFPNFTLKRNKELLGTQTPKVPNPINIDIKKAVFAPGFFHIRGS